MAEGNSDGESALDLFGQPVRDQQRGRGRPEHEPSRETVNRVWLGFARGWSPKEVASSIGVTVPTLRKHYFSACQKRHEARLMIESLQLGRLNDEAEKGNVAAEKELMRAIERGRREQVAAAFAATPPQPKAPKLGKKEQAKVSAKEAKGRYAPPEPPSLLN